MPHTLATLAIRFTELFRMTAWSSNDYAEARTVCKGLGFTELPAVRRKLEQDAN